MNEVLLLWNLKDTDFREVFFFITVSTYKKYKY